MKRFTHILLSGAFLVAGSMLAGSNNRQDCGLDPNFLPRSQSRDKVRQNVGVTSFTHLPEMNCWYGMGSLMLEYTRSFRPNDIARCLFGSSIDNDCSCPERTIFIQGSNVANRKACAWLADNFYLRPDFDGSFKVTPRISNILLDLDLYVGIGDDCFCANGWYVRFYGPITHTRWDLEFRECPTDIGDEGYDIGYFAPVAVASTELLDSFSQYVSGCQSPTAHAGVEFRPLQFARMDCTSRNKTGFADLRMELGWDFWNTYCYHVGANIQAAAPTGNKQNSCFLFNPVVGNGNHWELGAGITAHYIVWMGCDEDRHLGLYLDANITHMFKARALRTFDLCGKPNSRYMLAQRLDSPVLFNLNNPTDPQTALQFKNILTPVANLTSVDLKVSYAVQADIVLMANYQWCNYSIDLGYNYWSRSCTKYSFDKCRKNCQIRSLCDPCEEGKWALKGDARLFGFTSTASTGLDIGDPVALAATQSLATICSGTNALSTVTDATLLNSGIDNPTNATGGATEGGVTLNPTPSGIGVIQTSIDPVVLKCDDINFQASKGVSHKIFAHLSYNWWDCECYVPFLGIGGMAEFGEKDNCCPQNCPSTRVGTSTACNPCTINDPRCVNCALSQWGVWLKGGLAF